MLDGMSNYEYGVLRAFSRFKAKMPLTSSFLCLHIQLIKILINTLFKCGQDRDGSAVVQIEFFSPFLIY